MEQDPWADAPPSPKPSPSKSAIKAAEATLPSSPLSKTQPVHPSTESQELEPPAWGTSSEETKEEHSADHKDLSESEPVALSSAVALPPLPEITADKVDDGFDEFDDFDTPAAGPSSTGLVGGSAGGEVDDDGFGDFGDFEEAEIGEPVIADEMAEEPEIAEKLNTLILNPLPSRPELLSQLASILSPLTASTSTAHFTEEPPRQVGGINQILISESSRDAYAQLTTPPILKTLDWTRSRVRREHLISMGVPVNLDEVDSHRLSALPPLRITTSNMPPPRARKAHSVDTNGRHSTGKGKERDLSPQPMSAAPASSGNGEGSSREGKYGLGARPVMDQEQVERLCGLEEDQLSIMSLANLKILQDELVSTSASASSLLAWLLQLKDAQTQDSTTYNGMISELIANAAKAKQAQSAANSGGGVFRRASQRQRPQSMLGGSGTNTPRRTGSPAV